MISVYVFCFPVPGGQYFDPFLVTRFFSPPKGTWKAFLKTQQDGSPPVSTPEQDNPGNRSGSLCAHRQLPDKKHLL